ncbi:MAG: inositol-3-phosphate synthase [Halofilum sp. (in: g-proteobacteria)]
MERIRIAIVGVGNCASALMQGIAYYRAQRPSSATGLMHWEIGGYRPGDIDVVAAFDIDARKVGHDVAEAIFAAPNCAQTFHAQVPLTGTSVRMSPVLDGFAEHMNAYPEHQRCVVADAPEPDMDAVCEALRASGAEMVLNYLPVGSEQATRFYAECALRTGMAFVNMIPVFIASDPAWAARFEAAGVPLIGDDIKSQLGATIVHRALAELFAQRGAELDRTYQLNTGGNTDFLNMLDRERLESKRVSKTEAVHSIAPHLDSDAIHVGPSDYVSWQQDNKVCFIRMEARIFGDVPVNLELRLSVEDSPNSAGVAIDALRCCKLGLARGLAGVLDGPASYFCKHPPTQHGDELAYRRTEAFIAGEEDPMPGAAELDDIPAPAAASAPTGRR